MNSIFYIVFLVAAATAEDLSQGNEGTNLENNVGYTFNSLIDHGGKPSASAYAYLGGKLTQVPPSPTYYQSEPNIPTSILPPAPSTSTMLGHLSSATYFVAGVASALSIWYVCSIIALPHHKKSTEEFKDEKSTDSVAKDSSEKDEKKIRKRRSVRKSDEDMTLLASMVLSAVQSGECLQKSICLLGTQIGGRKGKMADGLLSTLLPASIQQSDYYIILRKSLRGEIFVDKQLFPLYIFPSNIDYIVSSRGKLPEKYDNPHEWDSDNQPNPPSVNPRGNYPPHQGTGYCIVLTSAAQALAKMAGKKKQAENISLQIEVETEMQWRTLLRREGLILVDVYASWAGPCTSMISILKRVKVEVNDDRLWLATACSDNISDLLMFKDQSEPTWLFVGGGKPVKVFRGSNAPKLIALIKAEFENELMCMQGKAKRALISIDDEVSRRKKAEAEAQKLAKMIKDEDEAAQELNELRKESSIRLMDAMEPYTVLVIQNFLLETGAVTEIRDYLLGEFRIEQERYVNLNEEGVRQLFRIPYEIPDPAEPEDFGYTDPEEATEQSATDISVSRDEEEAQPKSGRNSLDSTEGDEPVLVVRTPKKKKKKMLTIRLPEGLLGDTLIMLLESLEIRKMIVAGKKPDVESLLQTADDYIQLKVGPVDYKDALEHSPYSLHAIYGKEPYCSGVWCPRRYDDKRYVMINFFPRFVTEMLMPPPQAAPKYTVAIFPAAKAANVAKELANHKKDLLAEGKVSLQAALIQEMLEANDLKEGEKYEKTKQALTQQVYAVSVNRQNSEIMMAVRANDPIHVSVDKLTGKVESAKLFSSLGIKLDEIANPDTVVEKFLARSNRRVQSVHEFDEPIVPAKMPQSSSTNVTAVQSATAQLPVKEPSKTENKDEAKAAPPSAEEVAIPEPAEDAPSEAQPEEAPPPEPEVEEEPDTEQEPVAEPADAENPED
ncbi:unnamed protein product [Allacma fusca]|uniref:Thioredoxin domain-containing protein n=1 Tax=Allacma fusca TaxID=39272 RepID=A0A8J2PDY3_9HEXA|nr:unnamed protein product [Allacma fusca]